MPTKVGIFTEVDKDSELLRVSGMRTGLSANPLDWRDLAEGGRRNDMRLNMRITFLFYYYR